MSPVFTVSEVPVECSWRIPGHAHSARQRRAEEDSAVSPCALQALLKSAGPAWRFLMLTTHAAAPPTAGKTASSAGRSAASRVSTAGRVTADSFARLHERQVPGTSDL